MPFKASPTKQLNRKSIIKSALIIFLTMFLVLSGVVVIIYYLDLKTETKIFEAKERQIVELQRSIIASDFNAIFSHLMILSELNEYRELFESKSPTARQDLSWIGRCRVWTE
ncbi:MAG: hypothetical protein KJP23_16405, partial [Deltaproteobacteria bacterium]|nr:hypothetical protein [Deltaproteobacteria bacterium]